MTNRRSGAAEISTPRLFLPICMRLTQQISFPSSLRIQPRLRSRFSAANWRGCALKTSISRTDFNRHITARCAPSPKVLPMAASPRRSSTAHPPQRPSPPRTRAPFRFPSSTRLASRFVASRRTPLHRAQVCARASSRLDAATDFNPSLLPSNLYF